MSIWLTIGRYLALRWGFPNAAEPWRTGLSVEDLALLAFEFLLSDDALAMGVIARPLASQC